MDLGLVGLVMFTIWIPTIIGPRPPAPAPVYPCGMTELEAQMVAAIIEHPAQARRSLVCDERLCRAAREKAEDQAANGWWTHDNPHTRETPNELVRRYGFRLPGDYDRFGNNVESLGYGTTDVAAMLAAFLKSAPHRAHVAGTGWFAAQDKIGVGYARGEKWPHLWVVLTAREG